MRAILTFNLPKEQQEFQLANETADWHSVTSVPNTGSKNWPRYARRINGVPILFYHRGLRRMVVIELKLGPFQPEHMGQMELCLRWLERHEMRPGGHSPIGLILCTDQDHEEVEILRLDQRGIRVAKYLTELPPREILEKQLHHAVRLARERLAR